MKKLTPAYRLLLIFLWRKQEYFSKNDKLDKDGSFYYDDMRLAAEVGVDKKTIMRAKRFLKANGYISIENGKYKGSASKYWVLLKPDKKSPFVDISKPDNLPVMGDRMSKEGCQNVTPNNIINKETNNNIYIVYFESLWKKYPNRVGKEEARRYFEASVKTEEDVKNITLALDNYCASDVVKQGYIQNGANWFKNWQEWIVPPKKEPDWTDKYLKKKTWHRDRFLREY